MKSNMSPVDRILRVLLAALAAYAVYAKWLSGVPAAVLGIVAGVFVLTSIVGFCPLYALFGLSTKKKAPKA